ncbi:Gfo/Idh/MocA family oxidoreductase [bacterium]|jgi:predicted dehydrogenase|nr:Gfo/Idh/MocA family oxidoreductase [bacterium]
MNILIIGFGSIGQRHLQNLHKNYPDNNFYVLKKSKHNNVLVDCKIVAKDANKFYHSVEFIDDIETVDKFDIAFICNNTNEHMSYALSLAKKGTHIFVEKPLSHNVNGFKELEATVKDKSIIFMVGYQTKFSPVYLKIKELIKNEKISFVNSRWLTYLPNFHPYEDYKNRYAAKKSLGGGVALTLIHEMDMLNSLLGDLKFVNSVSGNYSSIDIEADDYLSANFKSNNVAVNLNLSFAQIKDERVITINTSNKTIMADFTNNTIKVFTLGEKEKNYNFKLERNELFESEVRYFFKSIKDKKNTINTIEDSLATIKLISNFFK